MSELKLLSNGEDIGYTKLIFHEMDYYSNMILIDVYTYLKDPQDPRRKIRYKVDDAEEIVETYGVKSVNDNIIELIELPRTNEMKNK